MILNKLSVVITEFESIDVNGFDLIELTGNEPQNGITGINGGEDSQLIILLNVSGNPITVPNIPDKIHLKTKEDKVLDKYNSIHLLFNEELGWIEV